MIRIIVLLLTVSSLFFWAPNAVACSYLPPSPHELLANAKSKENLLIVKFNPPTADVYELLIVQTLRGGLSGVYRMRTGTSCGIYHNEGYGLLGFDQDDELLMEPDNFFGVADSLTALYAQMSERGLGSLVPASSR